MVGVDAATGAASPARGGAASSFQPSEGLVIDASFAGTEDGPNSGGPLSNSEMRRLFRRSSASKARDDPAGQPTRNNYPQAAGFSDAVDVPVPAVSDSMVHQSRRYAGGGGGGGGGGRNFEARPLHSPQVSVVSHRSRTGGDEQQQEAAERDDDGEDIIRHRRQAFRASPAAAAHARDDPSQNVEAAAAESSRQQDGRHHRQRPGGEQFDIRLDQSLGSPQRAQLKAAQERRRRRFEMRRGLLRPGFATEQRRQEEEQQRHASVPVHSFSRAAATGKIPLRAPTSTLDRQEALKSSASSPPPSPSPRMLGVGQLPASAWDHEGGAVQRPKNESAGASIVPRTAPHVGIHASRIGDADGGGGEQQQQQHRQRQKQRSYPSNVRGGKSTKGVSNKQTIHNAIVSVCLAGIPNEQRRVEALRALDAHAAKDKDAHFAILLVEGITLSYRGVYAQNEHGQLRRIVGKGPAILDPSSHIEKLYKYSSTGRRFTPLHGKPEFPLCAGCLPSFLPSFLPSLTHTPPLRTPLACSPTPPPSFRASRQTGLSTLTSTTDAVSMSPIKARASRRASPAVQVKGAL